MMLSERERARDGNQRQLNACELASVRVWLGGGSQTGTNQSDFIDRDV